MNKIETEYNETLIEIVIYLLHINNFILPIDKLHQLMYQADKCFLKAYAETISGDTYILQSNGPVLSTVTELINDKSSSIYNYITINDDIITSQCNNFNAYHLSKAELWTLNEVNTTLNSLLKYNDEYDSLKVGDIISVKSMMRVLGYSDSDIDNILLEKSILDNERKFFYDC